MTEDGTRDFLDLLGPEGRRRLLGLCRSVRVRKGQSVLARGEQPGDVFIVREGRLQVVLYAADGREVSLRHLSAGQLFGELAAIDGHARSVGIVALADSVLLAIGIDLFRAAVRDHPAVADWLLRRLAAQVRGLTDRVFELSTLNVRARLHCELMRLARSRSGDGDLAAPTHEELANRIGSHREAVTRELKVLADLKIVRGGRRRLEFLDIQALERVVAANLRDPLGDEGHW